jgi:prepilin-type N-terminal cleavage/methylation domain-containing protein
MMRRGFTLVEMLVATIVFLVGFVAVFGLFLGGMRFRKLADDTTRSALAASCLIDEIRAKAGGIPINGSVSNPLAPLAYQGSGFATGGAGVAGGASALLDLYPYPPIPGTWYRVMHCTDINGDPSNIYTTVLHLDLVVIPFATSSSSLSLGDLKNRLLNGLDLSVLYPTVSDPNDQVVDALIQRGIAFRFQSVITRRPSWMP